MEIRDRLWEPRPRHRGVAVEKEQDMNELNIEQHSLSLVNNLLLVDEFREIPPKDITCRLHTYTCIYIVPTASICFEVWGSLIRCEKFSISLQNVSDLAQKLLTCSFVIVVGCIMLSVAGMLTRA